MSQEKVNKYKEQKANRKKIMKKEKHIRIISRAVGSIIGIALIGWIGYSAYDTIATDIASAQTEVELSAITNYINGLSATDAGTATDANTAEDAGTATDADTAEDAGTATDADTAEDADAGAATE